MPSLLTGKTPPTIFFSAYWFWSAKESRSPLLASTSASHVPRSTVDLADDHPGQAELVAALLARQGDELEVHLLRLLAEGGERGRGDVGGGHALGLLGGERRLGGHQAGGGPVLEADQHEVAVVHDRHHLAVAHQHAVHVARGPDLDQLAVVAHVQVRLAQLVGVDAQGRLVALQPGVERRPDALAEGGLVAGHTRVLEAVAGAGAGHQRLAGQQRAPAVRGRVVERARLRDVQAGQVLPQPGRQRRALQRPAGARQARPPRGGRWRRGR